MHRLPAIFLFLFTIRSSSTVRSFKEIFHKQLSDVTTCFISVACLSTVPIKSKAVGLFENPSNSPANIVFSDNWMMDVPDLPSAISRVRNLLYSIPKHPQFPKQSKLITNSEVDTKQREIIIFPPFPFIHALVQTVNEYGQSRNEIQVKIGAQSGFCDLFEQDQVPLFFVSLYFQ